MANNYSLEVLYIIGRMCERVCFIHRDNRSPIRIICRKLPITDAYGIGIDIGGFDRVIIVIAMQPNDIWKILVPIADINAIVKACSLAVGLDHRRPFRKASGFSGLQENAEAIFVSARAK